MGVRSTFAFYPNPPSSTVTVTATTSGASVAFPNNVQLEIANEGIDCVMIYNTSATVEAYIRADALNKGPALVPNGAVPGDISVPPQSYFIISVPKTAQALYAVTASSTAVLEVTPGQGL